MEQKFYDAWNANRTTAAALGVRIRPIDTNAVSQAKRNLGTTRLSDGFRDLAAKGKLELSMEALVIDKRFTALFTDDEANEALTRLLEAGYRF